ncbi:mitochondrial 54S ribosomal protein uL4m [Ascoidea rubescens DSM 1968]|uniref:Large ribosomal subunit protein uL4m n=1 Tax=Ascoidea rubescens DSM 1968 TaxID=1344418 RepID=A0A1D2VE74_9ASCO|nr:ribosomal protein L4 [Ascoidea rubescens DSM 1968]ODV59820.1 ribosomal protein L4 [Ascoidea rubescens DSM 1968]
MFIGRSIISPIKNFWVRQICQSSSLAASVTESVGHNLHPYKPPRYVLASLRSFPSLEPKSFISVNWKLLAQPLRRDILWKAVVMEANCARVGASNPPSRSQMGYSGRKLHAQKGTGRARVGDKGSPIRLEGGRAHARNAPNDYSTKLPFKVYTLAYRVALSHQYKTGNLFIVGLDKESKADKNLQSPSRENEVEVCEFLTNDQLAADNFVEAHDFKLRNVLFIVNEERPNLTKAFESYKKFKVIEYAKVDVRDLLKANRVIIEFSALTNLLKLMKHHEQ